MTDSYPVFVDGQTLTHDSLNDLHGFLDAQDHRLGQLIGFGIACGLEVTVEGDEFIVSPGLGIDQVGRPIVVREEQRIGLGADTTEFEWLERSRTSPGTTVVLTLEEALEDAPDCEEDGCTRHAATIHRRPVLRLADGCLPAPQFRVEDSDLRGINPITVTRASRPSNRGIDMTQGLLRVLTTREFPTNVASILRGIQITNEEIPGAAAYKAGFLNQLFFAMIEYLRCETLTRAQCFRDTATPGIALGCLIDGRWVCDHGHHWTPQAGLAQALLGGGCEDPCRFHRRRIITMIESFVLPEFPEPDDPPRPGPGGPYRVCRRHRNFTAAASEFLTLRDCYHIEIPDLRAPDLTFFDTTPDFFTNPSIDVVRAQDVYGRVTDPIDAGVIDISPGIGHGAEAVAIAVAETIRDAQGPDFPVEVITIGEGEVSGLTGYVPAVDTSVSDQIVLVQNAAGMVTATGRVPVNEVLNQVGPTVSGVAVEAAGAAAVAVEAAGQVTSLAGQVQTIGTLANDLQGVIVGVDGSDGLVSRFELIDGTLSTLQDQVLAGGIVGRSDLSAELGVLRVELQGAIDEARIGSVNALTEGISDLRSELNGLQASLRTDIGEVRSIITSETGLLRGELNAVRTTVDTETSQLRGQVDAVRTNVDLETNQLRTELGTVRTTFDTETTQLRTEVDAKTIAVRNEALEGQDKLRSEFQTVVRDTDGRIDDVLVGQKLADRSFPLTGTAPGSVLGSSVLEAFRSMASAVETIAPGNDNPEVRAALAEANRSITRMETAAELGAPIAVVGGAEIVTAFERMAEAAEAAGVRGRSLTGLNRSIDAVRTELRP